MKRAVTIVTTAMLIFCISRSYATQVTCRSWDGIVYRDCECAPGDTLISEDPNAQCDPQQPSQGSPTCGTSYTGWQSVGDLPDKGTACLKGCVATNRIGKDYRYVDFFKQQVRWLYECVGTPIAQPPEPPVEIDPNNLHFGPKGTFPPCTKESC